MWLLKPLAGAVFIIGCVSIIEQMIVSENLNVLINSWDFVSWMIVTGLGLGALFTDFKFKK